MPKIDENTINNGNKLTDEQIDRITLTILTLAGNTNNAQAITLAHNLKNSKDVEEKRKWIVMFYVSCFQLLSFINTARDKDLPIDEYKKLLNDLFKGKIVNMSGANGKG